MLCGCSASMRKSLFLNVCLSWLSVVQGLPRRVWCNQRWPILTFPSLSGSTFQTPGSWWLCRLGLVVGDCRCTRPGGAANKDTSETKNDTICKKFARSITRGLKPFPGKRETRRADKDDQRNEASQTQH